MATTLEVAEAGGAAAASLSMADVDTTATGKQEGEPKAKLGLIEVITYSATAVAVVFSLGAMVIEKSIIVYVAMGICVVTAPYAAIQRRMLSKMESLREVHNLLRAEVNRLSDQNDELSAENDRLEEQANKVKDIEAGLGDIVNTQGESVNDFVKNVKENKEIQDQIKKNLEASVLQNILTVVIQADRDEDFTIDPEEVDMLILRLQHSNGIELEVEKFKAMLERKGYSLNAVLDVCRNLMDDDSPEEDKVIHVNTRGVHAGDI